MGENMMIFFCSSLLFGRDPDEILFYPCCRGVSKAEKEVCAKSKYQHRLGYQDTLDYEKPSKSTVLLHVILDI